MASTLVREPFPRPGELPAEISYSELMEGWLRDPVYRGLITPAAAYRLA